MQFVKLYTFSYIPKNIKKQIIVLISHNINLFDGNTVIFTEEVTAKINKAK